MLNPIRLAVVLSLFILLNGCNESGQEVVTMTSEIITNNGLAISGYDPVAYFSEGNPVKGISSYSHEWNGTTWQFSNDGNKQLFMNDPGKYSPQFGGRCALAMSLGQDAPGDPTAWSIKENKLYFNANGFANLLWKLIPGRVSASHEKWREKKQET